MSERVPGDRLLRLAPAILAVAALLLLTGGVAAFTIADRTYQASATLTIDQVQGIAIADGPSIIEKLSRLRVKYAGIIGTRAFSEPVAERAGVPVDDVADALFTNVPPVALVMSVGARDDDPEVARTVAQAAAEHLVAFVEREQEQAGIPADLRFEFRILTPATDSVPLARPVRRVGLVAAGLGILLAVTAAVVRFGRS